MKLSLLRADQVIEEPDARARLLRAAVGFTLGHTRNAASIDGESGACPG